MRWQHPFLLYLAAVVPLFFYTFLVAARSRKKRIERFGSTAFLQRIDRSVHFGRRRIKGVLLAASTLLLVVTLASPQSATRRTLKKKVGSEFFIALDTSLSMLAQDERPSRLARAKEEVLRLLGGLESYKVGLIIFAGTSFVQSPLTTDHNAIRFFLESVGTESLPVAGSDLKKTIENAQKSFAEERGTRKYLILFTDGEHLGEEDPVAEAREAAREGVTLFCVGFGSPTGALIPLYEKGTLTGYKKDAKGTTVVTQLNEPLLKEIAQVSGGRYLESGPKETSFDILFREVARRGKKETAEETETQYTSRFQIPLFLAFLLLMTEFGLSERRGRPLER